MKAEEKPQTKQKQMRLVFSPIVCIICACANLLVSAIMMFASLYSDCFGLGDYFKNPLTYIGFFDALIIIGFIFKLYPVKFMRFVAFAIVGFALYCGWSSGEFKGPESFWNIFIASGYGILAGSHIAVGLLSFRCPRIIAIFIGLLGLSFWALPLSCIAANILNIS